jgi:hypothetical protein
MCPSGDRTADLRVTINMRAKRGAASPKWTIRSFSYQSKQFERPYNTEQIQTKHKTGIKHGVGSGGKKLTTCTSTRSRWSRVLVLEQEARGEM